MSTKPIIFETRTGNEAEFLDSEQLVKKINAFLNVMLSLAITLVFIALTVAINLL